MHVDTQLEAALRALDHWPRFRLRLFFEGILVGILSGTVISFFRWGLEMGTVWRQWIYANVLASGGILLNLGWFAVLLAAALLLWRLGVYEPNAGGSGIPQVKGVILGAIRMRWLRILWVKLVGGIVGINDADWGGSQDPKATATVQNCANRMSGDNATDTRRINLLKELSISAGGYADYVGGIAGYNGKNGDVTWNTSTPTLGAILYGNNYVGGVAGYNDVNAKISNTSGRNLTISGQIVAAGTDHHGHGGPCPRGRRGGRHHRLQPSAGGQAHRRHAGGAAADD